MPKSSDMMLRALKLLSQRVVNVNPFLEKTACMNAEEREIIGYCYAYLHLTEDEPTEFNDYLEKKIIPALGKIGYSKWGRTELTDLGFVLGSKDEIQDDISNVNELLSELSEINEKQ